MVQPAVCLCQIFFSRSGFCSFIFCLFLSWTPVKGGLHLVGSPQPIVAAPGDDVILPCRLDPEWDAVGKTVEWSRPDLRPSGPQKRVEYVFVYRFRKTDRDMMMDTYVQRTSLSQDGLRRGDVSLTIRNVSLQDQGRFRCFIPRLGMEAELQLVVDPNFVSTTTTETIPDRNIISPTPQEETRSNEFETNEAKTATCSSSLKMKMIWILLLLSSCLCAATFEVNVTQSSYEAEENQNITLEWTFTSRTQGSYRELFVICSLLAPHRELVLYQVHNGVEIPDSQDDQFSGRVQIDKVVLREGRIRLHVSRLRTEDSGLYLCGVKTGDGFGSETCQLNVSGPNFAKMTVPHRNIISSTPQEETVRSGRRSRMFLLFPFILFIISLSSLFILSLKKCSKNTKFQQNLLRASASQFGCFAPEQTCVDMDQNSSQTLIVIPDQPQLHGNPGG